ncbi:MAG: 23S rRNA (adenine(2503)-C(2))-methyltransferase RlmN [Acidobacteriota bacterium]|jgi:23S rRNA (adenine2503-C2)-methyltransferase|nr:23S rRNA (adenine(2503)-C(2))-methyltransferase RlmN [Acidobacteriota bacterium]
MTETTRARKTAKPNLVGMASDEIAAAFAPLGEPGYRARQVYAGVYRKLWRDWGRFTDLGKTLRDELRVRFAIEYPAMARTFDSRDGTRRYLFDVGDGEGGTPSGGSGGRVEAVFIPEESRDTLCISTQVGCARGCRFCATGRLPFRRNLTAGEIAGQVLALQADRGAATKRLNIVVMGMGEPFDNYENVIRALRLMTDGDGMGIPPRRVTISTSGVVPGIERLAAESIQPNLAISLNATTDAVRDRLMPVNRKWGIAALLDACRRFPLAARRRITFEYVLIGDVNDSPEDARRLARLVGDLRQKVNLIPWNAVGADGSGMKPPPPGRAEAFAQILAARRITVNIRKARGEDVAAACGMLAGRESATPM